MTTKLERLQKTLPSLFQPNINPFVKALLEAWAAELEEVQVQLDETHNQLFIKLGEGNFLNELGKNYGVYRPYKVTFEDGTDELIPSLADRKFRELIPILSFYPKQVKQTIISALDVFWGPTYSRATITSGSGETYNFTGGKILTIMVDGQYEISISFQNGDFEDPAFATVDELIEVINRTTTKAVAVSYYNYTTGLNHLQIYTNTIGTAGSIQVTGGTANTLLNFSTNVEEFIKVGMYEIDNNNIIFRIPQDIPILLDTLKGSHHFQEGAYDFFLTTVDYTGVNNYLKEFNVDSHEEIKSLGGTPGALVDDFSWPGAVHMDDLSIYICDNDNQRILKKNLKTFANEVVCTSPGGVDLLMPSGITGDNNYIYITDSGRHEVIKLNKTDLSFDSRYGTLGVGNDNLYFPTGIVCKDGYLYVCDTRNHRIIKRLALDLTYVNKIGSLGSGNNNFNAPVDIDADDFGFIYISDYENDRIVKRVALSLNYVAEVTIDDCAAICYDESTRRIMASDWIDDTNEYIRIFNLNLVEVSSFIIPTFDITCGGMVVSPTFEAFSTVIDPNWPGSFLYDVRELYNSFTLTSIQTTLQQSVLKDNIYFTLQIDDSTDFKTDGGYLCIGFGSNKQETLIPYLGKPNSTSLSIHPAYRFLLDHSVGERINHVEDGNFVPATDGSDYPVFLIDPYVAKELVTQLVTLIKAAGVSLTFIIDVTQYKYDYLTNM